MSHWLVGFFRQATGGGEACPSQSELTKADYGIPYDKKKSISIDIG